jgi:uncharacterized ion transporter superfamily protein YfcC
MNQQTSLRINRQSFLQSVIILLVMMILAGILTLVVPAGSYDMVEVDGRTTVDPQSFHYVESPDYPIWRWLVAPIEVLTGPNGLTIVVITLFLLMVGMAFSILNQSGILKYLLGRMIRSFGGRKYGLILGISLFFMLLGALFGIFEEVVPLVPLMIGLSLFLGWDILVGLGISILAVNLGFSAAITNPFTIGVAQEIAGLPLFSGAWFRVLIFIVVYIIFAIFITRYARYKDLKPDELTSQGEIETQEAGNNSFGLEEAGRDEHRFRKAVIWLTIFLVLILAVLISGPVVPEISDYSLPLVGVLFLAGGAGAGFLASEDPRQVTRAALDGLVGIAPAVLLILMAASVQFIVYKGNILDTLLYEAASRIAQSSPYFAVLMIYLLALLIEFFVPSGSAKAFLLMPVLVPLADLVGITRQVTVTAYCFGDGFSNLAYPTNPVLLICLGLAMIGYPNWLKWSLRLWVWVILATVIFLWIGVAIDLGPF